MAFSTAIIVAIFLLVLWMFLKFKEVRHRLFGGILIVLLLVLFLSSSHVIKKDSIDLKSSGGWSKFGVAYMSWLGQAFGNVKTITGDAVNMEWGLNEGNSTEVKNIKQEK